MLRSLTIQRAVKYASYLPALFNWVFWAFLTFLLANQFLGIVWDSTTVSGYLVYGRSPLENPLAIVPGLNDEPYSDRNIVCMAHGRSYIPMQLSKVLADARLSQVVDTTGASIDGYRVTHRDEVGLDPMAIDFYMNVCSNIDQSLEAIQDSCDKMGYNVTRDVLHIVDGVYSNTTQAIPRALPILVMPFWDSATRAHYAIPGTDGMACLFRLRGLFTTPGATEGTMRGALRSVRDSKTRQWLGKPGGVWRNGWYEDGTGQRWNSDMDTSNLANRYGIECPTFDVLGGKELDCKASPAPPSCRDFPVFNYWGSQVATSSLLFGTINLYISNGSHFGHFLFEAKTDNTVRNKYTLETLLSNLSTTFLCMRWLVAMATMLNSYRRGLSPWETTGLGCLSSSRAFALLPFILLPRLRHIMAVFWSIGCQFQGSQEALSSAWFAMYPAICEFVLLLYSVLNAISKITHRRMSDALAGPTLFALALLHYYRGSIARLKIMGVDGRVPTIVLSTEFEAMYAYELFDPSVGLRVNGNVRALFYTKLVLVAINFVPLLLSRNMTQKSRLSRSHTGCKIEKTLALRASNIGGLGLSSVYRVASQSTQNSGPISTVLQHQLAVRPVKATVVDQDSSPSSTSLVQAFEEKKFSTNRIASETQAATASEHVLVAYEINRLGYIVFGDKYLITYEDWYILTTMAPLRVLEKLWNHRITIFDVTPRDGGYDVSATSRLVRLDDAELRRIPWYNVTTVAFR